VIDVKGNILNCKYLTSTGTIRDEFTIIKPGFPTSAVDPKDSSDDLNTFSIWPNPVLQNAVIRYYLNESEKVSFDVLDISGRLIYQHGGIDASKGMHTMTFPMQDANLPRGIYLIRMIAGQEAYTRRFIIN
jgi:hypothetical protein